MDFTTLSLKPPFLRNTELYIKGLGWQNSLIRVWILFVDRWKVVIKRLFEKNVRNVKVYFILTLMDNSRGLRKIRSIEEFVILRYVILRLHCIYIYRHTKFALRVDRTCASLHSGHACYLLTATLRRLFSWKLKSLLCFYYHCTDLYHCIHYPYIVYIYV